MSPDDIENLRKFSICADQFGDGMTLAPQALLAKAHAEIAAARSMRLNLDRRIHNQRAMLRKNWEIIEMRAQYARAWYPSKLLSSLLRRQR